MEDKKPLTDDEKFEVQLQAEQDLARLQRQYVILDKKRSALEEEAGSKLAKQRKVLSICKTEQVNLLADLNVANAKAKKKEDQKVSDELFELLAEYDLFDEQIKQKKSYFSEISEQIKVKERQVLELAAKQISDPQYQRRVLNAQNTVAALENKLEVQIKKFCTICGDNIKLREQIDHMLKDRVSFNKQWNKLISNLRTGKKFMLDLIEQATIAYDQREEWCSRLQFLRNKAHNDLISHIQEMRELQRKEDNNSKLKEFFTTKGQKRIMRHLEEKEKLRRQQLRENMEKQMENYQDMMNSIYEFTGEENIEIIAKKFIRQEEENFGLFKYVNNLNKEIEGLNDTLGMLHVNIDEETAIHEFRSRTQEMKLEDLRRKVAEATAEKEEAQAEVNDVEGNLAVIKEGISKLFKLMKCDNDPLIKLLGENDKVNNYNVLLYLEIVEKRIAQYLINVYYKEKKLHEKNKIKAEQMIVAEEKNAPKIFTIEKTVKTTPCPLCVEHELVSDVIDVLQYVMSKKQAKDKLYQKRQSPEMTERLHNVSACHLPKSRQIIQKRYQ